MYRHTLEIVRCPVCGGDARLSPAVVLREAQDGEILDGILSCGTCERWFRVEYGIADLVRDGLREVEDERRFLESHRDAIPDTIQPITIQRDEPDKAIVDEGRHWGAFMRHFWDRGDRSIFDLRVRGTHPSLLVKGIEERDTRDNDRRWGFFPSATGRLLFPPLDEYRGERALDIGCGGGQFGLEAAYRGLNVCSFDPSFEEVRLGREHARAMGLRNIEYLRADPANPPFADSTFQLLMAKDSLHHVPELDAIFPRLLALLKEDGSIIVHEHVANARLKSRLMALLAPTLVEKARRRHPRVEVPEELLRDSANEDVSADRIVPLLKKHFRCEAARHDLFLAEELEMLVHYAFGHRRWLSKLVYTVAHPLERLLVLLGERQHLSYRGRKK